MSMSMSCPQQHQSSHIFLLFLFQSRSSELKRRVFRTRLHIHFMSFYRHSSDNFKQLTNSCIVVETCSYFTVSAVIHIQSVYSGEYSMGSKEQTRLLTDHFYCIIWCQGSRMPASTPSEGVFRRLFPFH